MMGRFLYGAAAVTLVGATALIAETPRDAPKADAERRICRASGDIGTRLGRSRACHTEQEWVELRRQTKQTIDHIQNARAWNQEPPH